MSNKSEFGMLEFTIGQIVYLKTDYEQLARIVTGIYIRENSVSYIVSYLTEEYTHYGFEMTSGRDIVKATSG